MKREDIHWLDAENDQPETEIQQEEPPAETSVSENPHPDRKIRKKHWLVVLIILCIACIGAFFLSDTFYNMVHHQTTYTLESAEKTFEYASDGVTGVYPFHSMFLRVNRSGVQAVDSTGKVCWDVPYTMSGPAFSQAGSYAAIADLRGNHICIFNETGQVGTITTEGPILFCTINEQGSAAVILNGDTGNTIQVIDRSGNILVRRETSIAKDGIPIAIALNEDGTCLATSYVIYTETDLRSAVTLFNLTNETSQTADKIAGNYSYPNTLVTELRYFDDMLMYIGDNRIGGIRAAGTTEQLWEETLAYRILSIDFGSDYAAVLYGEGMAGISIGADSNLIAYKPDGTRLLEMNIEAPETLNVTNDIIVYQDSITYNAIDVSGNRKWYYTPSNALHRLFALNEDCAVCVTADSIELMNVVGLDAIVGD